MDLPSWGAGPARTRRQVRLRNGESAVYVDEVDAEKVKGDKRLPFGLPGVNKAKKVSNANYLWLSYFYSYLNETGRAGVVMSSQASSSASSGSSTGRRRKTKRAATGC